MAGLEGEIKSEELYAVGIDEARGKSARGGGMNE